MTTNQPTSDQSRIEELQYEVKFYRMLIRLLLQSSHDDYFWDFSDKQGEISALQMHLKL